MAMPLKELHEQSNRYKAYHKRRIKKTGSFKPETIISKFFQGELCDKDGDNMSVDDIMEMCSIQLKRQLLCCFERYKIQ